MKSPWSWAASACSPPKTAPAPLATQYVEAGGAELSDLAAAMAEMGGTDFEEGIVNGIPCPTFSMPEDDGGCVAFAAEMGNFLVFTFAPISDEEFAAVASIMIASIQAAE